MGVSYDMSNVESAPAPNSLLERSSTEPNDTIIKTAAGVMGHLVCQEKKVWESKLVTPAVAMDWSSRQVSDWREVNRKQKLLNSARENNVNTDNQKWVAPAERTLKLNVDASIFSRTSSFSIGMVLRGWRGTFLWGKNMRVESVFSVFEAESFCVLELCRGSCLKQFNH